MHRRINSPLISLIRSGRPIIVLLFRRHGIPLLSFRIVPPSVVEVGSRVLNYLNAQVSFYGCSDCLDMDMYLHTAIHRLRADPCWLCSIAAYHWVDRLRWLEYSSKLLCGILTVCSYHPADLDEHVVKSANSCERCIH